MTSPHPASISGSQTHPSLRPDHSKACPRLLSPPPPPPPTAPPTFDEQPTSSIPSSELPTPTTSTLWLPHLIVPAATPTPPPTLAVPRIHDELSQVPRPISPSSPPSPRLDPAATRKQQRLMTTPKLTQIKAEEDAGLVGSAEKWRDFSGKCDENAINGTCQTCTRLQIECLGWGPRRPEWMRDKDQVDRYKAQIKSQLANRNMIRGIPRTRDPSRLTSTGTSTNTRVPPVPSLQTPGAGPSYPLPDDRVIDPYGGDSSNSSRFSNSPLIPPIQVPSSTISTPDRAISSLPVRSSTGTNSTLVNPSPQPDLLQLPQVHMSPDFCHSNSAGPGSYIHTQLTESPNTFETLSLTPSLNEQLVVYYFQNVIQFQFPFSTSASVSNAIHNTIIEDPNGPVTGAVCALACIHAVVHRRELGDLNLARSFYEETLWKLQQSKETRGQHSEIDVMAAIHLISYWLFCGGIGEWPFALEIAREWVGGSQIVNHPNPKMCLFGSSDAQQFIYKSTMWMDIFASVSLGTAPRFLPLYHRLFNGGSGFWAQDSPHRAAHLRMDIFMGCPDEAILAFAECAALSNWKDVQRNARCLSVRDLVDRATAVENELRQAPSFSASVAQQQAQVQAQQQASSRRHSGSSGYAPSPHVGLTSLSPVMSAGADGGISGGYMQASPSGVVVPQSHVHQQIPHQVHQHPQQQHQVHHSQQQQQQLGQVEPTDVRGLVGEIFRAAAFLYLHIVTNDPWPSVPEIRDSVQTFLQALNALPPASWDRSLVLPICIAACVADDPVDMGVLRERLVLQSGVGIGNVGRVLEVVDGVWERRRLQAQAQAGGGNGGNGGNGGGGEAVDWRTVMQDRGMNLLLV
ncbi:hypothetical protein SISSUDRAFT_1059167 [Sistotremastrum suecicum HHB10207 ss-3]|uniref:Zn(2)-C6 fungal-type domain-containing protein n=1 Tax=Sistotremastrum suecicum HHB10207 ss-3 TaxID=1314776 RepID=A0A166GNK7_9AGAM|nr:hypothetical protein SISSUDRAFT_1059167 [Sistotremastrum suecicum HHB10207 ss-3]